MSNQVTIDAWDFDIASILVARLLDNGDDWREILREFAIELLNRALSRNERTIQYASEWWDDFRPVIEHLECQNERIRQALAKLGGGGMDEYTDKVKEVFSRQIRREWDVRGNIIEVHADDCLIIIFEDGRWAHYAPYAWPEGGGGIVFRGNITPDVTELCCAGLLSDAELEEQRQHKRAYWDERKRKHELELLRKLREKYGDEEPCPTSA